MNAVQLIVLAAVSSSSMLWPSAQGVGGREYLPAAVAALPRQFLQYPSYYPQYASFYYPQYNNGFIGGYQHQALGQHITAGTALGLNDYYANLNGDLVAGLKPRVDVIDTVYDSNGGYVYGRKK